MVEVAMDLYSTETLDKKIVDIKGASEIIPTIKEGLELLREKLFGITNN